MLDIKGRPVDSSVYDNFINEGNGKCVIKASSYEALRDLMSRLPYSDEGTPLEGFREYWWNGRLYAIKTDNYGRAIA